MVLVLYSHVKSTFEFTRFSKGSDNKINKLENYLENFKP